jgi:hypothetical protein
MLGEFDLTLTVIEADVVRVVESEVSVAFKVSVNLYGHMRNLMTDKYFITSANQKLSLSSIKEPATLLTSFRPVNPVGVFKNLLKLCIALAARSRYFESPVTRYA